MLCSACGEITESAPCAECGAEPQLAGRYRLLSRLGSQDGATGVFVAQDLQQDCTVTVKERVFASSRDLKDWELFHREWEVLSQLSHPFVPRYVDHFEQGEGRRLALYIVVEHIDGVSLQQELATTRKTTKQAVEIVIEVLEIIDALHRLSPPVVHRDIKPANIIRDLQGRLHLIDFGSVKAALQTTEGITMVGTFGYMAPEQLHGDASPASDLYACGALLLALLTREDPARLLSAAGPDWRAELQISAELEFVISRLTEPEPADRPGSARAAIELLQDTTEIKGRTSQALVRRPAAASVAQAPPANALDDNAPLSLGERKHAEALAKSLIVRGVPLRDQRQGLLGIMQDPGIPIERRAAVHAHALLALNATHSARARAAAPFVGAATLTLGALIPIITWTIWGSKAFSYFGWFSLFMPLGLIILYSARKSSRPDTAPPALGPGDDDSK